MRSRPTAAALAIGVVFTAIASGGACSTFSSENAPSAPPDGGGGDAPASDVEVPVDGTLPPADAAESGVPGPTVLAMGYPSLRGVAANETTVFFIDDMRAKVFGVPLAGGAAFDFAPDGESPSAIVVIDDVVVWSDYGKRKLKYLGITGGTVVQTFLTNGLAPTAIAVGGPDRLVISALDPADNKGDIQQYTRTLMPGPAPTANITLQNPFDVAVSANGVYWTESSAGNIWRGVIDAPGGSAIFPGQIDCQSIAADDLGVYWTRPSAGTVRANVPSVAAGVIDLSTTEMTPHSLAADGIYVYWLTGDGKLRRSNRDVGLPVQTLASGFQSTFAQRMSAQAIALTSKYVVWITTDGQVLRQEK